MLHGIVLQPQMDCKDICLSIQKMINRYVSENGSTENCVLTLDIRQITDSQEISRPLALPLKEE